MYSGMCPFVPPIKRVPSWTVGGTDDDSDWPGIVPAAVGAVAVRDDDKDGNNNTFISSVTTTTLIEFPTSLY